MAAHIRNSLSSVLAQTLIRAPVTGTVGNRNAEVGMTVNPGTRLFTLGQLDSVRIEVILTDRMLNYIEPGQRVEIRSSALSTGEALTASLSRISPFLHPVTHSTDAEIEIANPGRRLKSGMFVATDIFYGESEAATLVPLSALYDNPHTGATGVYICRDTTGQISDDALTSPEKAYLTEPIAFEFVPVEILARGRMSAGIRGVQPDDWVVTIGQDLFGGESGEARVRLVHWNRIEHLQTIQREDLLDTIMKKQQATGSDSIPSGI
jgi:HlyD family secretion protein